MSRSNRTGSCGLMRCLDGRACCSPHLASSSRLVLRVRWLALIVTTLFLSLTASYDMSVMPLSLGFPRRAAHF
jgi:hypothetical protein